MFLDEVKKTLLGRYYLYKNGTHKDKFMVIVEIVFWIILLVEFISYPIMLLMIAIVSIAFSYMNWKHELNNKNK